LTDTDKQTSTGKYTT